MASIRFLTAHRRGRLCGVSGIEETLRVPEVREVSILKPLGTDVREAEEAADRIGFVIVSGPSRGQVLLAADENARTVQLEISDDSDPC